MSRGIVATHLHQEMIEAWAGYAQGMCLYQTEQISAGTSADSQPFCKKTQKEQQQNHNAVGSIIEALLIDQKKR